MQTDTKYNITINPFVPRQAVVVRRDSELPRGHTQIILYSREHMIEIFTEPPRAQTTHNKHQTDLYVWPGIHKQTNNARGNNHRPHSDGPLLFALSIPHTLWAIWYIYGYWHINIYIRMLQNCGESNLVCAQIEFI